MTAQEQNEEWRAKRVYIKQEDALSATLRPKNRLSSINFQKSIRIQTEHNDRTIPPEYIKGDNFEVNRNSSEALALKERMINNAQEAYKRHTGQKFQAKSFEWSAVVNIKPDTTMQDLENLAKFMENTYGFQCYQIAIHRDEGHYPLLENGERSKNLAINHHAHLEFITLDKETGRNNYNRQKISPKTLREIQTQTAKILGMERGVDKRLSGARRLDHHKYRHKAQQQEQEIYQATLTQKSIKQEFMNLRKTMIEWGFCDKDDYRDLSKKLNEALESAKNKQFTQADLDNAISKLKQELEQKHAPKGERQYFKVPFGDKDEFKALGGQWDRDAKKWYVSLNAHLSKFEKWQKDEAQTAQSHNDDLKALENEIIAKNDEIERLKTKLKSTDLKLSDETAENRELSGKIENLQESLKNASKINENQKGILEALEKEKMDLNAKFERLNDEHKSLQQEHSETIENLSVSDKMEVEILNYLSSKLARGLSVRATQESVDAFIRDVLALKTQNEDLKDKNESLLSQINELKELLEQEQDYTKPKKKGFER